MSMVHSSFVDGVLFVNGVFFVRWCPRAHYFNLNHLELHGGHLITSSHLEDIVIGTVWMAYESCQKQGKFFPSNCKVRCAHVQCIY
jgi:hypothetical protein